MTRARARVMASARADLGPAIQVARGDLRREPDVIDTASGRRITRARRRDGLQILHAAGGITDRLFHAAERFRDDLALAGGARENQPDSIGSPAAPWDRSGATAEQLAAIRRLRRTVERLDLGAAPVFIHVVIEQGTVREWERQAGKRNGSGTERLSDDLQRLADYYDRGIPRPLALGPG